MIPLVFEEPTAPVLNELLTEDKDMAVWWGTWIKCSVAVSYLRRESKLTEMEDTGWKVEHFTR